MSNSHVFYCLHLWDGVANISVIILPFWTCFVGLPPNLHTLPVFNWHLQPNHKAERAEDEQGWVGSRWNHMKPSTFKGFIRVATYRLQKMGLINLAPLKDGWQVTTWSFRTFGPPVMSKLAPDKKNHKTLINWGAVGSCFMWIFFVGLPLTSLNLLKRMQAQNATGDDPHGDACEGGWQPFGEV